MERMTNIAYGPEEKWQLLDLYRPKAALEADGSLKKLPVIISVHGGAWVYGDKDKYQFYCMRLAQHGFAVVNFSYRLAPERKFPASVEDTEAVFQWVCDNAEKYALDTSNVFAVGDSAGGHLLSLYADAITNKEYAKAFPFIKEKPMTLRGLALNCGKYTMDDTEPKFRLLRSGYLPNKGTPEEVHMLDAAAHVAGQHLVGASVGKGAHLGQGVAAHVPVAEQVGQGHLRVVHQPENALGGCVIL